MCEETGKAQNLQFRSFDVMPSASSKTLSVNFSSNKRKSDLISPALIWSGVLDQRIETCNSRNIPSCLTRAFCRPGSPGASKGFDTYTSQSSRNDNRSTSVAEHVVHDSQALCPGLEPQTHIEKHLPCKSGSAVHRCPPNTRIGGRGRKRFYGLPCDGWRAVLLAYIF